MIGSMRRTAMLAVAMMAMGAAAPAPSAHPRVMSVPASAAKPGRRGLFNDAILPTGSGWYGRKGAGISMAAQKRTAAKRRNVARNRRAHR